MEDGDLHASFLIERSELATSNRNQRNYPKLHKSFSYKTPIWLLMTFPDSRGVPMPIPIQSPSGYAATRAVVFADASGDAQIASAAAPLPVTFGAPSATALAGTSAASALLGPFQPVLGRAVILALAGTWAGTIKVLRSTDGGTTKLPLTVASAPWGQFTSNCCEPVWEESEAAATLWLDAALTSGTLNYRLAQ
jgi:hypothetical protein